MAPALGYPRAWLESRCESMLIGGQAARTVRSRSTGQIVSDHLDAQLRLLPSSSRESTEPPSRRNASIAAFILFHSEVPRLKLALQASGNAIRQSSARISLSIIVNSRTRNNATELHALAAMHDARVIRNELRPEKSPAFLARDWNAALMLGFGSLSSPEVDMVVLMQVDALVRPTFFERAMELHLDRGYEFASYGRGDELHSYSPGALRRVGMWDELFAGLSYHEADYYLRAAIDLGCERKAMVSDWWHGRLVDPLSIDQLHSEYLDLALLPGGMRPDSRRIHRASRHYAAFSLRRYAEKWLGDARASTLRCLDPGQNGANETASSMWARQGLPTVAEWSHAFVSRFCTRDAAPREHLRTPCLYPHFDQRHCGD